MCFVNALQAEKVLGKFETHGTVLGDLGLASIKLAKFEDEVGTRCGSYTDTAMASKAIGSDARRVGMVRALHALLESVVVQSKLYSGNTWAAVSPL